MKSLFRKLFPESEEHKQSIKSIEEVKKELERFNWEVDMIRRNLDDRSYN